MLFNFSPRVLLETPDDTSSTAGPWAKDLEEMFEDPAVRGQVDGFLREKVQPHVTRLEQSAKDVEDAKKLFEDLTTQPGETYLDITAELFGEDAVERVLTALREEAPEGTEVEEVIDEDTGATAALAPEDQEALAYIREQRRREEYAAAIGALKEAHKEDGVEIDENLFHPFVYSAKGDLETAYRGYKQFYENAKSKFGGAEIPEDLSGLEENAPPTLDSTTTTPTTPPTEQRYTSLDDALDSFFGEQRPAPPTVGSV